MVMAPTAMSPPYFKREELKQTVMMLSLACMMKVASPRAMQGRSSFGEGERQPFLSFRMVFLPMRKQITQTQEMP